MLDSWFFIEGFTLPFRAELHPPGGNVAQPATDVTVVVVNAFFFQSKLY